MMTFADCQAVERQYRSTQANDGNTGGKYKVRFDEKFILGITVLHSKPFYTIAADSKDRPFLTEATTNFYRGTYGVEVPPFTAIGIILDFLFCVGSR